jgi:hypothetical protein
MSGVSVEVMDLPNALSRVLQVADCSWVEAMHALSFVLVLVLLSVEDDEPRIAAARTITDRIMQTARDGRLPSDERLN